MTTYKRLVSRPPRQIEPNSGQGAAGAQGPQGPAGPAGPSGPSGVVTIVVNRAYEWSGVVSAPGLFSSNRVVLGIAPHDDADENDAEMLDVRALSGRPSAGSLALSVSFGEMTHGPVKINWGVV